LAGLAIRPLIRKVTGIEKVPAQGAGVMVANHLSVTDGAFLCIVMNARVRHAHFLSYKYLFKNRFLGFMMRFNEGISLDSSTPETVEEAMVECRARLRDGRIVGLFPEAHTSPFGKMHKARPGAVVLALETGAPILPVGLVGTQNIAPRKGASRQGRRWKAVSVHFGDPVDISAFREIYVNASRRERLDIALGLSTIVMRKVASLSGQEYLHGQKPLMRLKKFLATAGIRHEILETI
jgi:1-acyl-sn-glycerol-3-phosphate acyltransferase